MLSTKRTGTLSGRSIGALLLEVFLIILGVMVALAANEWREGRAVEQRTELALENIRLEIARNQRSMQERLTYHEALRDSIRAYLPDLKDVSYEAVDRDRLGMPRGLRFLLIYDAAWQTALASQVLPHVDYETLAVLSTIYQVQDNLKLSENRLLGILFTQDNFRDGYLYYAVLVAQPILNDLIGLERNLRQLYDEALQRLGDADVAR